MKRAGGWPVGVCAGAAMLVALSGSLGGCGSTPEAPEPEVRPRPLVLPTYAQVAAAQNRRAAMLDRVWAAVSAIVTYEDQDGVVRTEQAEGYLQIIQPDRVALSLGKQITSEVYFYLGCDDERYWWFDRLDAERKVAYIGTHEMATPERAALFGAPVHPLDLLDLLGITALPEAVTPPRGVATGGDENGGDAGARDGGNQPASDPTLPEGARLAWSPDGQSVVVDVPGRFGTRRTWFEPGLLMPRRVEMLDGRGRVVVSAVLSGDVVATVAEDSRQRPLVSQNAAVSIPGTQISIRLLMDRVENRGSRQREAPFDLDGLLRAYPVDRIEDIDLIEVEVPAREAGGQEAAPPEGVRTPDRRLRTAPAGP